MRLRVSPKAPVPHILNTAGEISRSSLELQCAHIAPKQVRKPQRRQHTQAVIPHDSGGVKSVDAPQEPEYSKERSPRSPVVQSIEGAFHPMGQLSDGELCPGGQ